MDLDALIDEITELVLARLGRVSRGGVEVQSALPQTLIVLGNGERGGEHLATHIRAAIAAGGRAVVVPSALWPRERIAHAATADGLVRVIDAPMAWSPLVNESRLVLVPNLSLSELSSFTHLLNLTPASSALLAALVEGRPVLAGGDDVNLFSVHAARLPKALVEAARSCVSTAAAMGLRVVEAQRLPDEILAISAAPAVASRGAGRDVLTRDDVESMLRGGATSIEVAAGTIVTPLASEVARAAGAEIRIR